MSGSSVKHNCDDCRSFYACSQWMSFIIRTHLKANKENNFLVGSPIKWINMIVYDVMFSSRRHLYKTSNNRNFPTRWDMKLSSNGMYEVYAIWKISSIFWRSLPHIKHGSHQGRKKKEVLKAGGARRSQ